MTQQLQSLMCSGKVMAGNPITISAEISACIPLLASEVVSPQLQDNNFSLVCYYIQPWKVLELSIECLRLNTLFISSLYLFIYLAYILSHNTSWIP